MPRLDKFLYGLVMLFSAENVSNKIPPNSAFFRLDSGFSA